jgi:hypothetical protein
MLKDILKWRYRQKSVVLDKTCVLSRWRCLICRLLTFAGGIENSLILKEVIWI